MSPSLLQIDADVLQCVTSLLNPSDLLSLSSTCSPLRAILGPPFFASCRWQKDKAPPASVWPYVRHLYIDTDNKYSINSKFFHDLSRLQSVHISAQAVSANMIYILSVASEIDTLDLSSLCYRPQGCNMAVQYEPLDGFPPLSCRPTILKFCSHLGKQYTHAPDINIHRSRIRATRYPLVTLLHEMDVAQIKVFEVSAEALSLPHAVAYTWSSLRELTITGFWLHACDGPGVLDDSDTGTPAWIYDHLHLGTLLIATPRLRVLRLLCRYADYLSRPQCDVWPPGEPAPSSGTAIPLLEELQLCNPVASDGIFTQLQPSLRSLSLLSRPHLTQKTDENTQEELEITEALDSNETLVPSALIRLLSAASLPDLRELRFSFRNLEDMHLFEFIAARFPCLELLEFHAETGPGCLWTADDLAECARALSTLARLRVLRVNTFYKVLLRDNRDTEEYWEALVRYRWGIPRENVVAALFGPLRTVREVWLPLRRSVGYSRHGNRVLAWRDWQVHRVDWDETGGASIHEEGSPISMNSDE
ncbi:hypothetical protein BD626DRAFT_44591 [Schizophyllum amplum]|uniref:F-box domain-containing protein n=1 Tax=Schizophyllum amplum TaxID=97359 RepID=A0A550CE86_9AGAR|nr:hypothetical protein BD626DRAFT_44591 [Auriculariopsis ampla]